MTPADQDRPRAGSADPDTHRAGSGEPGADKLLRWYPRAWRERYGEEFMAMVEETLDGHRPTLGLRLSVAWAGLRERGHQAGLNYKAAARRLDVPGRRWTIFVIAFLLTTLPVDFRESPPPARAWSAATALDVLAALVVLVGAAILAGGLAALPALVRFLRAGGWRKIRRRIAWATGATAVAGGGLAGLVLASRSQTFAQLNGSWAYFLGVAVTSLGLMVALGLWTSAAAATARHLDLSPRVRAAQMVLGGVTAATASVMLSVNLIWLSAIQSSVPMLLLGIAGLAVLIPTAAMRMRRVVRSGRRLRRTVTR